MKRDNSPVKNTCPLIDQAIDMFASNVEDGYCNKQFQETMELIRIMNTELRDWGNEQYERAEELERNNRDLVTEITQLGDEVNDLKLNYET